MPHNHADSSGGAGELDDPLNADDLRGVSEELSAHFPPPRAGTELVLLEVAPRRVHAYWNIDLEDYRAAQARTGSERTPLVIRLFDITDGTPPERAMTAFDNEVQGLQGHAYLDLWKDGRTHQADLGFRDPEGRLIALARSNAVSNASAGPSDTYHTQAVDTAAPESLRITDLVLDPDLNPENTDTTTGAPLPDAPAAPAPAPVKEGAHEQEFAGWPSAECLEQLVPRSATPESEAPVEKANEPEGPAPGSPPPSPPSPPPPAPQISSPMPLDSYVGLSSFENSRREVALEVYVELHIHGRAKPGTELTLYGQPVPLRPDGTFSIRKPLPQGAVVLPLLAVDPPASPPGV